MEEKQITPVENFDWDAYEKGEVVGVINAEGPVFDYLGELKANAAVGGRVVSLEGVDLGQMGSKKIKEASVREKTLWELLNAGDDTSLSPEEKRKYIVEGHRRLVTPWYNLVFALLACTGLLVGNFNRRGQTKIISISVLVMILVQGNDLIVTNLAGRSLYFLPMLYVNCFMPLGFCIYLLLFYNPFFFVKRRLKEKGAAL